MGTEASPFTDTDLAALAARGVAASEALRQLALLAQPPGFARLDRPCVDRDGVVRLDDDRVDVLLQTHAAAAHAGRVSAFVPASGAASRMFKELLAELAQPGDLAAEEVGKAAGSADDDARALVAFVDGLPRFAFAEELAAELSRRGLDLASLRARGPWRPLLAALLEPGGLGMADRPKGLLPFHRHPGGARTAFEEHLEEAASLARDAEARCRLHFTVSADSLARFEAQLEDSRARLEPRLGVRYDVRFSLQHPATDTLAGDPAGGPFRGPSGELLFRPAGHGALLRNLSESGGDLVFLKNIDNVAAMRLKPETARWSRALVGLAAELSANANGLRRRLDDPRDGAAERDAAAFLRAALGEPAPPAGRAELAACLERPLRVAGMVRNTGEPGGGPFWVRGRDGGITRQIVESAEVDGRSPEQRAILGSATHFNPVFLAIALRDHRDRPHDLERFVDPEAVIITRKSAGGRELLALERPGLWNGAMARWNTVFVEVPIAVFNPVKSVLDLLRPEHQS